MSSEKRKWEDLGVATWLIRICKEMGLALPTEIQKNTIPPVLQGKDVIGGAPTGSGKTICFALPILQTLSLDPYGIYALVLTPTRELAFQIADQFNALGAPIGVRVEVVVGGKDMVKQALELSKKPHIVIATPGRLVDHLNSSSTFSLSKVLDEADRLVTNKGMVESIEEIIQALPPSSSRQTLLFSATMTPTFEQLEFLSLKNPVKYSEGQTFETVETLQQEYMFMPAKVKDCYLVYLLRLEEKESDSKDEDDDEEAITGKKKYSETEGTIIIFTSTCYHAQLTHEMLKELGLKSVALHSELSQAKRLKSLDRFKSGFVKILVATDVASRGLDIPSVQLVINLNVPKQVEDYVHRVGRTARAGRGGKSITLITQHDIERVLTIEQHIGKKLELFQAKEDDILRHMNETITAKSLAALRLQEQGFGDLKKQHKAKAQQENSKPNKKKRKHAKTSTSNSGADSKKSKSST